MAKEPRTKIINFRITDLENQMLCAAFSGAPERTLSDFIRRMLLERVSTGELPACPYLARERAGVALMIADGESKVAA